MSDLKCDQCGEAATILSGRKGDNTLRCPRCLGERPPERKGAGVDVVEVRWLKPTPNLRGRWSVKSLSRLVTRPGQYVPLEDYQAMRERAERAEAALRAANHGESSVIVCDPLEVRQ